MVLDENESLNTILASDNNTLTLEQIISGKIPEAIRVVSEVAPVSMLDDAVDLPDSIIEWEGAAGVGRGTYPLPNDFLRLVVFQMSDWKRVVSDVVHEADPEYDIQLSKFAGVKGNPDKPICAIITTDKGIALEFYSCKGGSVVTMKKGKYIPMPSPSVTEHRICSKIYTSIIYYAAALTALTYKDAHSETLFTISKSHINQ